MTLNFRPASQVQLTQHKGTWIWLRVDCSTSAFECMGCVSVIWDTCTDAAVINSCSVSGLS